MDALEEELVPRPGLDGDIDVDVAIVGGGYTGLWTAYYLKRTEPALRVAILESEICGFGASGRNGGWCSALFAASKEKIARAYGRDRAIALQREMFHTVDEVGRVCAEEGIDAHYLKGGTLTMVTDRAQLDRVRGAVEEERAWGLGEEDIRWVGAVEANKLLNTAGSIGAVFTPHCARVQPARLARGLASVVADAGVAIYERTPVTGMSPGTVETVRGKVKADVVVRATEGYTTGLPGEKRTLVPLYSLMVATEPLPSSFWDQVGWEGRQTMTDGRHLIIYAQRTHDDRIAFGGRGAPYHFGSRISDRFDRDEDVFAELQRVLVSLWPAAKDARITHRWGGPLGVPRDWFSSVGFDRDTRVAWAGGYVGDGVSTTNLAGRTLTDMILGRDTELTRLPWAGHRSRKWEPEPLRWIGTNLALKAMASADRVEARTHRPAKRAELIGRLIGH
jgi:glycine/D-amino acid oxidase-like deaminating enzyme